VSAQHSEAVEAAAHQATGGSVPYKHRKSTFRCVLAQTTKSNGNITLRNSMCNIFSLMHIDCTRREATAARAEHAYTHASFDGSGTSIAISTAATRTQHTSGHTPTCLACTMCLSLTQCYHLYECVPQCVLCRYHMLHAHYSVSTTTYLASIALTLIQ
jgi:hypothetical protein